MPESKKIDNEYIMNVSGMLIIQKMDKIRRFWKWS